MAALCNLVTRSLSFAVLVQKGVQGAVGILGVGIGVYFSIKVRPREERRTTGRRAGQRAVQGGN